MVDAFKFPPVKKLSSTRRTYRESQFHRTAWISCNWWLMVMCRFYIVRITYWATKSVPIITYVGLYCDFKSNFVMLSMLQLLTSPLRRNSYFTCYATSFCTSDCGSNSSIFTAKTNAMKCKGIMYYFNETTKSVCPLAVVFFLWTRKVLRYDDSTWNLNKR